MKTLYVMRHAEARRRAPGLADEERPLSESGEVAAGRMGALMAREGMRPDLVLCSSARRARETAERIAAALPEAADVIFEDEIYDGGADDLLLRLRRLPDSLGSAMLVGHNPELQDLALALTGGGDPGATRRLRGNFPAGALLVFEVPLEWERLDAGGALLIRFVGPRDLEE